MEITISQATAMLTRAGRLAIDPGSLVGPAGVKFAGREFGGSWRFTSNGDAYQVHADDVIGWVAASREELVVGEAPRHPLADAMAQPSVESESPTFLDGLVRPGTATVEVRQ